MDHRPEPALLPGVAEVSLRLILDDESLVSTLQAVATAGCSLVDHCSCASITILQSERPATVASTDDTALALDDAQYRTGDGPCLTAAREQRVVHLEHVEQGCPWPEFGRSAAEHGIGSVLSTPFLLPGPTTFGGLNLYSSSTSGFDGEARELAEVFASQASIVVTNALAYWHAFEQSRHLTTAMESRAEIEQAKGVLMATQRCSADEAFDLLRRASQRENRKLREIAAEIVQRASRPEGT